MRRLAGHINILFPLRHHSGKAETRDAAVSTEELPRGVRLVTPRQPGYDPDRQPPRLAMWQITCRVPTGSWCKLSVYLLRRALILLLRRCVDHGRIA
ncbi:hypothetical protein ABH926_002733 [Catenulispora sp. GP43]